MRALLVLALLAVPCAHAAPIGNAAPPPQTRYEQRLGAQLPLDLALFDEHDRAVTLGAALEGKPGVLVFGYYHCPNLCETVGEGVLEALAATPLGARDYRVVMVSIDPRETAAMARRKQAAYGAADARWKTQLALLRGQASDVARLARIAGFHYRYDPAIDQYVHPAGFLVASADGRISRYFLGVRYAARDVKLALVEAGQGEVGSPVDQLLLLCSHYDPAAGRYTVRVMWVIRAIALTLLAALALWLWRHRRGERAA